MLGLMFCRFGSRGRICCFGLGGGVGFCIFRRIALSFLFVESWVFRCFGL